MHVEDRQRLTDARSHICSDLAALDNTPIDARQRQLPVACKKLERAIERQAMSSSYESYEAPHFYRLKETAKTVLINARSISSRTPTSTSSDAQTDTTSVAGQNIGQGERDMIEMWIQQLRAVKEEPEEMEEYTFSDLPEVSSSSFTQETTNGRSSETASTRPVSEYEEDDYELTLVRNLTNQGKHHFGNNNRVQAIDCLERALQHAGKLSPSSSTRVDLTEIRAILSSIYLQRRELQTAEHHLVALIQHNPNTTSDNSHHISTAHLQLAQLYLVQRNFDEARKNCDLAIRGRMKLYGKNSLQSHEALQLQALIFHAEGSHPEAEALLGMLPLDRQEQTRYDMQAQAQGGPKFTLFPSPRAKATRPSFSSDRATVHAVRSGAKTNSSGSFSRGNGSISRDNGSISVSRDNISLPIRSNDSTYSESTYAPHGLPPAPTPGQPPSIHLDRAASVRGLSSHPPPSSGLPFRGPQWQASSPFAPNSPQVKEQIATSKLNLPSHRRQGRTQSSPPATNGAMDATQLLERAGFTGDFDANKALVWAIQNGLERVVHTLLDGYPVQRPKRRFSLGNEPDYIVKQASPNGGHKDKQSPLILAIQHGQVLIVRLLLERGASLKAKSSKKTDTDPLISAAEGGSAETIRLLFDKGVFYDFSGSRRHWTAWHAAAQAGHEEVMQLLLTKGVSVDAEDPGGATALKLASARGHLAACDLLIQNGANVDHADDTGWTPLLSSIMHGHTEVTYLLINSNANIDQSNDKKQTPLMIASREGRQPETVMLLRKNALLEQTDNKSWTPLLAAARYGHVEITQLLIQHGANVDAHCSRNSTPLDHAIKNKHRAIQQFLKGAGAHQGSGLTEPHTQQTAFTGYAM